MSDSVKYKFNKLLRFALVSIICVVACAVIGIIYGLISTRIFTLQYVFSAVFVAGAVVILIGVVAALVPIRPKMKDSNLIDHSNYAEITMERREKKRKTSHFLIYLGISITMIAAVIQWILSLIIV